MAMSNTGEIIEIRIMSTNGHDSELLSVDKGLKRMKKLMNDGYILIMEKEDGEKIALNRIDFDDFESDADLEGGDKEFRRNFSRSRVKRKKKIVKRIIKKSKLVEEKDENGKTITRRIFSAIRPIRGG